MRTVMSAVDFDTRYRIALGVAECLCYLHSACKPQIIHRDIKSNNILLDESMEAHVGDFGLAKLIDFSQSKTMSAIAGSYGYIAPGKGGAIGAISEGHRPLHPELGHCSANARDQGPSCRFSSAVLIPLHHYQQKHPLNFVFLGLFTLCLSLSIGVACTNTEGTCLSCLRSDTNLVLLPLCFLIATGC